MKVSTIRFLYGAQLDSRGKVRVTCVHMIQQAQIGVVVDIHVDQRGGHDVEDDVGADVLAGCSRHSSPF